MTEKATNNYYAYLAPISFFFGVSLCLFSVYKIVVSSSASEWRETQGTIIKSEIVKVPDHPSQPHVVYEYIVNGERFTSDEIAFLNVTGGSLGDKTVAAYSRGKIVSVYYDPNNPARSVLEPKLSIVAYFMLAAGALCLVVWLWASIKMKILGGS